VLPIGKMPRVLQRYSRHTYVRKDDAVRELRQRDAHRRHSELLHTQYGQTFTGYKPAC